MPVNRPDVLSLQLQTWKTESLKVLDVPLLQHTNPNPPSACHPGLLTIHSSESGNHEGLAGQRSSRTGESERIGSSTAMVVVYGETSADLLVISPVVYLEVFLCFCLTVIMAQ